MYTNHIIIDFEMNPVSKKYADARTVLRREIIEIGAVKLNSRYEVVDRFSCFIRPEYSVAITDYITKLTGIRTADVKNALNFEDALMQFNDWIGNERNRIYSWSDADLKQITAECEYKNVTFPANITRWMDFQVLFPRLMGLNHEKLMSLTDAANWYGVEMDCKSAHRALYDADVTSELVRGVLTGEYKAVAKNIHQYYRLSDKIAEQSTSGVCLGDLLGDVFRNLIGDENNLEFSR